MTARGAEGDSGPVDGNAERRAGVGQRVHFEALVAVGESGGAGFDAESMNISPEGMRLRTAYLPEVGDKLVCRFDGVGADVTVDGEVIWREEAPRGGEFGIRFLAMDPEVAEALRAMCAPPEAIRVPAADASRGTRVRLHIEGLGSPMKARVRETATGEMLVGSNLEFLRVGRALELEDVDHGGKREATIDHVKVEIDPVTNVPQLVVALAYAGKPKSGPASTRIQTISFGAMAAPVDRSATTLPEGTPAPKIQHAQGHEAEDREESAPAAEARAEESVDADDEAANDDDRDAEDAAAVEGFRGAGAKAARAGRAMADKIVPALSLFGGRAKGAMASAVAAIRRRKVAHDDAKKAAMPRRMTAPPPTGALKSEGRRLVREDDADLEMPAAAPKSPKRAAAIGSLLGLVAVVAIFGATRAMSGGHAPAPAADATAAATAAAPPAAAPPAGTGPVSANVPLFGATPLSTTEAVPAIPTPAATGGDPAAPPGAAAQGEPGAAEQEPGLDDDEGGPASKEYGNGAVKSPVVLRFKMDGEIERLNGAAGAMGFTISLPERRSLSSASELARKDKRIASINVINNAHGAEVTVQFKDGVPPYMAKAKGDRLEIAIGSEGGKKAGGSHKKIAKKGSDKASKKKAADAPKKGGSKAKAAAPKKKGKK